MEVRYIDMTEERKAQWRRVTYEIIDLLKREFPDPIEAAAVVKLLLTSMNARYEISDSFMLNTRVQ